MYAFMSDQIAYQNETDYNKTLKVLLKRNSACIPHICRYKDATYHVRVSASAKKNIEQMWYCKSGYIKYYLLIDVISK